MKNLPLVFPIAYHDLLLDIIHNGVLEKNKRTNVVTSTLRGGTSFSISLEDNQLPLPGNRKISPYIAAAEIAWYLQGSQDIGWLQRHTKIWDKFLEKDKKTIKNAYGFRWRYAFHRDQIYDAIAALITDPSSRQVLISTWDPEHDGLCAPKVKNIPCPTHFTLNIIDGRLYSSLFIRSSDVFVGLPYDVLGHTLLMNMFASTLQCKIGSLHVTLANAHIYKPHFQMALDSLAFLQLGSCAFPNWTLYTIIQKSDEYVEAVRTLSSAITWANYNPKPEIVL